MGLFKCKPLDEAHADPVAETYLHVLRVQVSIAAWGGSGSAATGTYSVESANLQFVVPVLARAH